jgi:hypothetical protein
LKSSTCNREEEGDLAAGHVGLLGVASSLQREREWLDCWTCRVSGAVAKVFDRKTQRSYRKKKKTTLVDFEGSIPCKNKGKEMEACKGRRREHEGQLKDYILSSFHYIFWLQDRTVYRLIKGSTSHKTLLSTPDDMGLDYAARIKEVGCCRLL